MQSELPGPAYGHGAQLFGRDATYERVRRQLHGRNPGGMDRDEEHALHHLRGDASQVSRILNYRKVLFFFFFFTITLDNFESIYISFFFYFISYVCYLRCRKISLSRESIVDSSYISFYLTRVQNYYYDSRYRCTCR